MSENLMQLENMLSEELRIFSNILRLEREKSEAIINKDGTLMQSLSLEQEKYLSNIAPIEQNRKKLIDQYSKNNPDVNLTLTDIALIEDAAENSIVQIGDLLKKILDKIKSLQETNSKMINDNIDFFSKMVNKLKDNVSMETGYGKKGMEKRKTINPLILDKRI